MDNDYKLIKDIKFGMNAINLIIREASSDDLKILLLKQYYRYEELLSKLNKYKYINYCVPFYNKLMMFFSIKSRFVAKKCDSMVSELMIKGYNIGIINGRKLINSGELNFKLNNITKLFINIQEVNIKELNKYL